MPVIYFTKTADPKFEDTYRGAKKNYENYLRAKAATDFIAAIAITVLGFTLSFYRTSISKDSTRALEYALVLIPPIVGALDKLYSNRSTRYMADIEKGKTIGYAKGWLYDVSKLKEENKKNIPRLVELDGADHINRRSVDIGTSIPRNVSAGAGARSGVVKPRRMNSYTYTYSSSDLEEQQEVTVDNEDLIKHAEELSNIYQIDLDFEKLKSNYDEAKKIIGPLYEKYRGIKNAKTFEGALKAVSAFTISVLALVASGILRWKPENTKVVDWLNLTIAAVPILAAGILLIRSIWFTCGPESIPKWCGKDTASIKDSLRNLKRTAYSSGFFIVPSDNPQNRVLERSVSGSLPLTQP